MSLTVRGLCVHYGSVVAASEVDLDTRPGEVLALLGPSGCGKSTLLRAITGLEPLTAGRVCWDGADLAAVPVHRRRFGLVFQDGQLFPHRDVAGNVEFGLRMAGRRDPDRVRDLLALVGLDGYGSRLVTELSGGQAQRVALARALAPEPRLLLLDEPMGALDRTLRDRLAVDLARLLRTTGTGAIVVTHDHDEAFTLADRVAVMVEGRVRQVESPHRIWSHPADEAVAAVLGCERFVDADVSAGALHWVGGSIPVDAVDGPARIGLRPSALRVAVDGPIAGTVVERLHRPAHVRLTVRTDALGDVAATAPVTAPVEVGDAVRLAQNPDDLALLAT